MVCLDSLKCRLVPEYRWEEGLDIRKGIILVIAFWSAYYVLGTALNTLPESLRLIFTKILPDRDNHPHLK